jgi:O-antigen/teichoic acid export membrane protein
MTLKSNLLKNGIAASLQKGVRILEQLLLVPFFLTSWGAAYYGEWLTLTIIPTMLGFSDLGFGTSAANALVLRYASGDKQGAANIAKTGLFIINRVVLCSILISALLIFILDWFKIFDKSLINRIDAIGAISLLMIARILNFYQQLFEAYYRSARKAALSINLQSIYSVLNITFGLIVLLTGGNIIAYASVTLIIAVIFNPLYAWKAKHTLALYETNKGKVIKEDIKTITKKGLGYLMSPIWQAIYFQGTTFVVRIVLGPEAVAIFNTVRTVTRVINQAYSMIISTILPELQFELGARNYDKARKIFRTALISVSIISILGSLFLYFGGSWFYEIWTRKALSPPDLMWNIFIGSLFFNAIWWTSSFIYTALNKPYEFAIAGVICSVISVVSAYFFAKSWGLTGAAVGTVIMDLLLFLYIFPRSCKLIGQKLKTLFSDMFNDFTEIWNKIIKSNFTSI